MTRLKKKQMKMEGFPVVDQFCPAQKASQQLVRITTEISRKICTKQEKYNEEI